MTKLYSATLLFLLTANAFSAEWGAIDSIAGLNSVEIVSPRSAKKLHWSDEIAPGENILTMRSAYHGILEIYFNSYDFVGVVGDSLQINATDGLQKKEDTVSLYESAEKTLFVERANDGIFYFIPEGMKGEGVIKIQRNLKKPGFYLVSLSRQSR